MFKANYSVLSLEDAVIITDAVIEVATTAGLSPVAVAVTGPNGELIHFACMDGVRPGPRHYAIRKAFTAAYMGVNSSDFAASLHKYGLVVGDFGDPRLIPFAGGVCYYESNSVVGAVGVSGLDGEGDWDDERLAKVGLAALDQKSRQNSTRPL